VVSLGDILRTVRDWVTEAQPIDGENVTTEQTPNGTRINVELPPHPPMSVPVKLTSGPDVDGFYMCDVYGDGTDNPATQSNQSVIIWGMYPSSAGTQGFWQATSGKGAVASADPAVAVWEVFPNLPIVPDSVKTYFLISVAGVMQWVEAGDCDA